jgi:hypothetical protein
MTHYNIENSQKYGKDPDQSKESVRNAEGAKRKILNDYEGNEEGKNNRRDARSVKRETLQNSFLPELSICIQFMILTHDILSLQRNRSSPEQHTWLVNTVFEEFQ